MATIEKIDGSPDRMVLIGIITSDRIVSQLHPRWEKGFFTSAWSNLVAEAVFDYFKELFGKEKAVLILTLMTDNDVLSLARKNTFDIILNNA